jgi:hypothetical protein
VNKKTDYEYGKRSYELLQSRSKLPVSEEPVKDITLEIRPDKGHKAGRYSLGAGYQAEDAFTEIAWRPAYHDLLDPVGGYVPGSQIKFFSIKARHYDDQRDLCLEELMLLDIQSLSPRNTFFKPLSWKINTGFVRKNLPDDASILAGIVNAGMGLDYQLDNGPSLYTLLEASLEISNDYQQDYALGIGPTFGLISHINSNWGIHTYATLQRYGFGEQRTEYDLMLEQSYRINDHSAMRLSLARMKEFEVHRTEVMASWLRYF